MSNLSIKMTMNGQQLSKEWIMKKELERTHHVIREMDQLGASFCYKGQVTTADKLLALPFAQVKEVLIETKMALGNEGILNLYKEPLAQSDAMWKEICTSTGIII